MEIGAFCNPLVPRGKGFSKINVDIASREALRARAKKNGRPDQIVDSIEEVDVVGDASRLAELLRKSGKDAPLNWIVSSHNFEHLPNPLGFLQDCGDLLADDGLLMMVIPDQRFIFDRFHPHTTTAQVLRAAAQTHNAETEAWAFFEHASLRYHMGSSNGAPQAAWKASVHSDQALVTSQPLASKYAQFKRLLATDDFRFAGHRWRFTPSALELLLFDLAQLQLTRLRTVQVHPTRTSDFLVILQRGSDEPLAEAAAAAHRLELCCRIENERAAASSFCQEQARRLVEQELEIERLRSFVCGTAKEMRVAEGHARRAIQRSADFPAADGPDVV